MERLSIVPKCSSNKRGCNISCSEMERGSGVTMYEDGWRSKCKSQGVNA